MKELLGAIIMFGALIGVWYWIASKFRRQGIGLFTRHFVGVICGVGAFMIAGILAAGTGLFEPKPTETADSVNSAEAPAAAGDEAPGDQIDGADAEEVAATSAKHDEPAAEAVEQAAPEPAPATPTESIAQQREEIEAKQGIGIDVPAFTRRFNASMQEVDLPLRFNGNLPALKDDHVQRSFYEMLNDRIVLMITAKPHSDGILEVLITGSGDGTPQSGANIMLSASSAFAATSSQLASKEALLMTSDMLKQYNDTGEQVEVVRNGLVYSYSSNDLFGNMFAVSPVKD